MSWAEVPVNILLGASERGVLRLGVGPSTSLRAGSGGRRLAQDDTRLFSFLTTDD